MLSVGHQHGRVRGAAGRDRPGASVLVPLQVPTAPNPPGLATTGAVRPGPAGGDAVGAPRAAGTVARTVARATGPAMGSGAEAPFSAVADEVPATAGGRRV